jgi:hypothetical protein
MMMLGSGGPCLATPRIKGQSPPSQNSQVAPPEFPNTGTSRSVSLVSARRRPLIAAALGEDQPEQLSNSEDKTA